MDLKRFRHSVFIGAVFAAFLGGATTFTWTQASPTDGPWSGWAQCELKTTATNYEETQTHTWRLTGAPPRVTGSTRHWPAVWTVMGKGQRLIASGNPGAALIAANTGGPSESWTIKVPETDAPIAFWELPATGQIRIGSQHGQVTARSAITVNSSASGEMTPPGSYWEWQFPSITGSTTATTIKNTAPNTRELIIAQGWQRPHQALTTETCAWDFRRGAEQASAPPALGALGRINQPGPETPTFGPGRSVQQVTPGTGRSGEVTSPTAPPPSTPPAPPLRSLPATPPSGTPVPPPSTPPEPPASTPPAPQFRTLPATPPSNPPATPPSNPPATPPSGTPVAPPSAPARPSVPIAPPPPVATPTTPPPPPTAPPGGRGIAPRPPFTMTPAPAPSTPTGAPPSAPAPASGTYLVSITGLICLQATHDSPAPGVDPDGRGDEVYAAAYVRRFNRTSFDLLETTVRQTIPYGDVTNYGTSRLQAGTQTPTGGVRAGDWVPGTLSVSRSYPAQESAFPFRVWQGQLTDTADALLISPMIWEHDGATGVLQQWVQSQGVLNNTIFMDPAVQGRAGSKTFGTQVVGSIIPQFPDLLNTIINGRQDRPVGYRDVNGAATIPNVTLVLTREIIEQALASQWVTVLPSGVPGQMLSIPKPGILVINFADAGRTGPGASYTLILQVEKVGG